VDLLAFLSGLNGDQGAAQHAGGILAGFFRGLHQHHARLIGMFLEPPLAPAAGVDLGLDDGDAADQGFKCLSGLLGRMHSDAPRHRNADLFQQCLCLRLVNFHIV
jgi:hypothetical protein